MKNTSHLGFPRGYKARAARVLKAGKLNMSDGTRVVDLEVIKVLDELIELDVDATEKIGVGIDHWVVYGNQDLTPARNSTGYRIVRVDGTGPITFGYNSVLKPKPHTSLVQRALTDEVATLMVDYRKTRFANGPVRCSVTGVQIVDFWNSKATHVNPSLTELHLQFLDSESLTFESVTLVKNEAAGRGFQLRDRVLAARWRSYQEARMSGLQVEFMKRHDRP